MFIENHNSRASIFEAELAEVLEKLYSVSCIGVLYRNYFLPSLDKPPAVEKIKKSAMISALVALETDTPRLKAFCSQMPPELQQALQILAWTDSCPLLELEKTIGTEIVQIHEEPPRVVGHFTLPSDKYDQPEIFELIAVANMRNYWAHREVSKDNATAQLPPSLQKFFKLGLPAPLHSKIIGLDEWAGEGDSTRFYNASNTLADDLRGMGDAFRRGNIKRNKNGSLSKSCLREFQKLMPGGEFFPPSDSFPEDLVTTRLRLLLEFFNRKGNPLLPPEDLSTKSLSEFLYAVAAELANSMPFVLEELLPHIRPGYAGADPQFVKGAFLRLLGLFSSLPDGQWVSAKNLVEFRMFQDIDLRFFSLRYYSPRRVIEVGNSRAAYYQRDTNSLSSKNVQPLLFAPMIQGMAFLLASLGLIEICYNAPDNHSKWRLDNRPFLTPFDGLEAVRLTPIGAFAFGRSKELPLAVSEKPKCQVHLHAERLLARATLLDPLTEKVLREFMEELEPGFYRLERKRFLTGCNTPKEIDGRVEDFKRRLPADLPPFWQSYLEGLSREGLALQAENGYRIYSLGGSPELARLFSTDPELRKCALRVEGRRVAISNDDFPTVRKGLLKAGFFV